MRTTRPASWPRPTRPCTQRGAPAAITSPSTRSPRSGLSVRHRAVLGRVEFSRNVLDDARTGIRGKAVDRRDVHAPQPRQLALRELARRGDAAFAQKAAIAATVEVLERLPITDAAH